MPIAVELWRRIEPILDVALELDQGQRAAYLDRACAGEPELRAPVEALLRCCGSAGRFLEVPAGEFARPLLANAEAVGGGLRQPSSAPR